MSVTHSWFVGTVKLYVEAALPCLRLDSKFGPLVACLHLYLSWLLWPLPVSICVRFWVKVSTLSIVALCCTCVALLYTLRSRLDVILGVVVALCMPVYVHESDIFEACNV